MKSVEVLINEHKAISIMLNIIKKIAFNIRNDMGVDINDLEKILNFLDTFIEKCHHGKEENVLFPALVVAGIHKEYGPVGAMIHEHIQIRENIKELKVSVRNYQTGNPEYIQLVANSLTDYMNLLHNHIRKEENSLFVIAGKILTPEAEDDICKKYDQIEDEIVGHGIHEQFHELLKQLNDKYFGQV